MTAIEAVSAYLPPQRVPVSELGPRLGVDAGQMRVYRRFYGFETVCYDPGASLTDLLVGAADKVLARSERGRVRYLIHARTLQLVAPHPANPLHEVRDALGLDHAVAFAVTQHACASGLLALETAGRLLASDGDPDALALVLTGEKAFTASAQIMPDVAFMGEGAAAVLVRAGGGRDRMLGYATRTHGQFSAGQHLGPELTAEYRSLYQDAFAEVVLAAVGTAGVALADVALLLPQNVNRTSWTRLCRKLGYPVDRLLLDNLPVLGHCFCADPFIAYGTARELGRLKEGDLYLMAAVGLGATFSAMVFRH
ncbi:3-oxoacyl-[acyl-carrier-protein] synthase III C-terminal domain-containing protein [Streptomyces sp. NPDC056452]|uniref:3-oxoacyl-[acyl-carrier-protein] synthase III C-terminal domain-containing protein n=1 Tax=Streptomyces sp. NPDC056452 TaxID=3345821 RepID=UPI00367AF81F